MAFARSLTTPVGMSGDAVAMPMVDPKWYLTDSGSAIADATDPTTRFQGFLAWQAELSASADTGLFAGYIGLEYECEFTGHRPIKNALIAAAPDVKQDFASTTQTPVKVGVVETVIGSYGVNPDSEGATAIPGYNAAVTGEDSFLSEVGYHMLNYLFPLLGTPSENKKQVEPKPETRLFRTSLKGSWRCTVGGAHVDRLPVWADVVCSDKDDQKSGLLMHPIALKDLCIGTEYRLSPNAAGDVTVDVAAYYPDTSVAVIASTLTSSGTGAITPQSSLYWQTQKLGERVAFRIATAFGDSRSFATTYTPVGGASETVVPQMSVVEVNDQQSIF